MGGILHKFHGVVVDFIDHGAATVTPEKALMMRRARGFGLVAFAVMLSALLTSLLEGRSATAYVAIAGMVVYGICLHWMSANEGRWAHVACNTSIAFLLAAIAAGSVYVGGAPSISVTYPALLILGTMYVLGVRTAAVWTGLSIVTLGYVCFTATLPAPAPGVLEVGPGFMFVSRSLVIVGVFAIASLGRRFEDQQTEQLQFMARHDPLTGLCNRREFDERLFQGLARAQRYRRRPALLFIDLDSFKQVNDQYGHGVGDDVLRGVAQVLQEQTRKTDAAGRIGGDEFVVLLEDAGDAKTAEAYAKRLLEGLTQTENDHLAPVSIRASIGVALFPDDGQDAERLIRSADSAMYLAKRSGGNCARLANDTGADGEADTEVG
jgi:diguanylate cyclase (GGDEF)-like protein